MSRRVPPRPCPDRGSGTVLVLALVLVVVTLAGTADLLGRAVLARHRAEAAADLAALAGAAVLTDPFGAGASGQGPCSRAARVSGLNAARMTRCVSGADSSVEVEVGVDLPGVLAPMGPARARSRAGPAPDPGSGGAPTAVTGP